MSKKAISKTADSAFVNKWSADSQSFASVIENS
jgi:hypothetical protein